VLVFVTRSAQAQTYTILYAFQGGNDGFWPEGGLLRDERGNLYGTTFGGGGFGYRGTAFKLDPQGKETLLYSFLAGYGAYPLGSLVSDGRGNFYGTTTEGGAFGEGTVFKLDIKGNEAVLHSFSWSSGDGIDPEAGVVLDKEGNVYGTTFDGSTNDGIVFKISKAGKETILHTFTGQSDGGYLQAGLVRDDAGNLYGAAEDGGDPDCDNGFGCGTIFKLDSAGHFTVLYAFTGSGGDGEYPSAGLIRDEYGNLYGTTYAGGAAGYGTVFKLDSSGKETVLYSFLGPPEDGAGPDFAPLVRDSAGSLYGVAFGGNTSCESGCGVVFKLAPDGKETVLHYFTGTSGDGQGPMGGLVLDGSGNLYGTTEQGGNLNNCWGHGCGIVFKLAP
jgi:uncharacterized repeat protein (TIGR03803 family)